MDSGGKAIRAADGKIKAAMCGRSVGLKYAC